jgi:hypothetical protein
MNRDNMRRGAVLEFRLSERARVTFAVRREPGNRSAGKGFVEVLDRGKHRIRLTGWTRGHGRPRPLQAGLYHINLLAADAAHNVDRVRSARFRIWPGR